MSDTDDWNDAWWHAQECDERWHHHMQLQAELTHITEEIRHAQSKRYDHEQVPAKRGL